MKRLLPLLLLMMGFAGSLWAQSPSKTEFFDTQQLLYSNGCPPGMPDCEGFIFSGTLGVGFRFGSDFDQIFLKLKLALGYYSDSKFKFSLDNSYDYAYNMELYNQEKEHFDYDLNKEFIPRISPGFTLSGNIGGDIGTRNIYLSYHAVRFINTGHYKQLSNAAGRITFTYGDYDAKTRFQLYWQNDNFAWYMKKRNRTDYGETQTLGLRGERIVGNNLVWLEHQERMFTDRRKIERRDGTESYNGIYDVFGIENSFHYYKLWHIGFRTPFNNISNGLEWSGNAFNFFKTDVVLTLGSDDLVLGRNRQRFAHQGFRHLPERKRKEKLLDKFDGGEPGFSPTPLFPWEEQEGFYERPRFVWGLEVHPMYLDLNALKID